MVIIADINCTGTLGKLIYEMEKYTLHKDDEYSIIIGYRMGYLKAKQNEINSEIKKLNKIVYDKEYDCAYRIGVNDMGGYI